MPGDFLRSQSEVVASIILIAIVVAAIGVAYLWGVPIFTKSGDVTLLSYVQDTFERIGNEILDVAREGGQRTFELRLEKGQINLELDETGEYILNFVVSTPASFFPAEGAPINDWTLPYQDKVDEINFTVQYNATTRAGNETIDEVPYSFYAYDIGADNTYDCVYRMNAGEPPSGSCIPVGGLITTSFRLDYLDPDGEFATLLDGVTTSVGIIGQDKPGVVVGKAERVGSRFKTTIFLKMREIFDPTKSELLVIELVPESGGVTRASGSFSLTFRNVGERVEVREGVIYRITTVEVQIT
jgi:flagellin-like protein